MALQRTEITPGTDKAGPLGEVSGSQRLDISYVKLAGEVISAWKWGV